MPWTETCAVDERVRMIADLLRREEPNAAVFARYGVSAKTGYKWLRRYQREGAAGLIERSHAPHRHGLALPELTVHRLVALRERWPLWGPRKLRVKYQELYADAAPPAASTIGDLLRREGLVKPRARRRRCPPYTQPFLAVTGPNDVWGLDFKGWFRTGDGRRCDPFTVSDAYSRYLLACQAVRPEEAGVRPVLEAAFCDYGLPQAIRCDNGPPFASTGAGGLSALALWWIKLGIRPERIAPAKPQQNGRHERMHRTLNEATATPPAATLAEQQVRFDAFRREYNDERPHEACDQRPPGTRYAPSPRPYPCALQEPAYGADEAVRRVRSNGQIKWGGELIFVSEVLAGECVGVRETEDGEWRVRFGPVELGFIDGNTRRLNRRSLRPSSRPVDLMEIAAAIPTTPQAQKQPQTV
jgi:putative transposase